MRFNGFVTFVEEIKTEDGVGSWEGGRWETAFGDGETAAREGYGYFEVEVVSYAEADRGGECL